MPEVDAHLSGTWSASELFVQFRKVVHEHTLALVQEYKGGLDATLLINCLLGLLVVPKETVLQRYAVHAPSSAIMKCIKPEHP